MSKWVRLPNSNFLNMDLVVGVDFAEAEALVWHTMDIEGAQNPWRFGNPEAIEALRAWVEGQKQAEPMTTVEVEERDNRLDQILAGVRRLEDAAFGCGPTASADEPLLEGITAFTAGYDVLLQSIPDLKPIAARAIMSSIVEAMRAARMPAPMPEPSAELAALRRFDKAVRAYLRACGGAAWKVRFAVESTLAADGKGR